MAANSQESVVGSPLEEDDDDIPNFTDKSIDFKSQLSALKN